jgi:hypothetical protein
MKVKDKHLRLCAAVISAVLIFSACGKGAKTVLNYEQPVSAMTAALDYADEQSYLSCFLPQAKKAYLASDDYKSGFISQMIDKSQIISRVRIKINDNTELDSEELESLQNDAKKTYGTRFSFTKGEKLDVSILVETRQQELSDSREITVVRYENVWYIYGDVIDSFSFV